MPVWRMATQPSERLIVVEHPLAQHKLGLLRDGATTTKDFRHLMGELAVFLCYEATRDLELEDWRVATPLDGTLQVTVRGVRRAGKSRLQKYCHVRVP